MSDQRDPITVQLPMGDCVVLSDGVDALLIDDRFRGVNFPPVKRAVLVARLRAIADAIENHSLLDDIASEYRPTT